MTAWSAIITTHNRAIELARTLDALLGLEPPLAEILVCADGCTDDTTAQMRTRYPDVRLLVNERRQGSVPSRDRLIRAATGTLVLSVDDDSYPVERDFLLRAAERFASDPRLAVLSFPQRSNEFPSSLTQAGFGSDREIGSYASSGVALRRAAYLALPGYAVAFGHTYEEPDYTLQCIAGGWHCHYHAGLTIRHHYSPHHRNEIHIHHLHARNEQWSIWMRCPSPWWPLLSLRRLLGQFAYACRRGPRWVIREPVWWWHALRAASTIRSRRAPVAWPAYRRWLKLLRDPAPLSE